VNFELYRLFCLSAYQHRQKSRDLLCKIRHALFHITSSSQPAVVGYSTMKRGFSTLASLTDDGNESKHAKKKSKTAQRRTKPVSKPAAEPTVVDSDNPTATLSAVDVSAYRARFDKLQNQVNDMSVIAKQQSRTISDLSMKLSTIMSAIQSGNIDQLVATAVDSFAAAVKRPAAVVAADSAVQQSVVAAVYIDNQRRQNRSTNFIVSGLPVSDIRPDQQAVVDLCRREFGESAEVVHCRRLGKPTTGRVQPLLVILKTAAQAVRIIASAKKLRQSNDVITNQNIFISPNLTKAEASAAYEVRCQRRRAAERRRSSTSGMQQQRPQPPPFQHHTAAPSQLTRHNIVAGEDQQVQSHLLPHQSIVSVEVHQPPVSSSSLSSAQLQQPQWWSQQQQLGFPPVHLSPPPSWQQVQQSRQQPSAIAYQQPQQPPHLQSSQSGHSITSLGLLPPQSHLPCQQIQFQQLPMTSSQQQLQSNTYPSTIPSSSQAFNPNASDFLPGPSPSYQPVQPR